MTSACRNCGWASWLEIGRLSAHSQARFNDALVHNRCVPRGAALFHAGMPLTSIYTVHSGFLKTSVCTLEGMEQVVAFPARGDVVGMEAIANGVHRCNAFALEHSSVCAAPYSEIIRVCQESPQLWQHFYRLLAKEIADGNRVMMMLGTMSAEARVADFLLQFSSRMSGDGYSSTSMRLPMKREELASFLGLRLETVCRIFGSWRNAGMLQVSGRQIDLRDMAQLRGKLLAERVSDAAAARSPRRARPYASIESAVPCAG